MNPYGKEYSWVYDNYSPILGKHLISVQWMRWQGAEFSLAYDNATRRDADLKILKASFAPHYPVRTKMTADAMGQSTKDFEVDLTLLPAQLIEKLDTSGEWFTVWINPFSKSTPILDPKKYWLLSKPKNNENRSRVGPFQTQFAAIDYEREYRPRKEWDSIILGKE